jgi:hypothetical protein
LKNLFKLFLTILIISCTTKDSQERLGDPFFDRITADLPEIQVNGITTVIPDDPAIVDPFKMVVDHYGRIIMAETASFHITMLNTEGKVTSRVGGIGAGPGEFRVINDLSIGFDNKVYVFDKGLQRVTIFSIVGDDLILDRILTVDGRDTYRLENLIVTEAGWFGLYKKADARATGDHRLRLYSVDDLMIRKEELLLLPGETEKKLSDRYENFLGINTLFAVYKTGFYYISSHSAELMRFDLKKRTTSGIKLLQNDNRENHLLAQEYMGRRMRSIIGAIPDFAVMIEKTEKLPLFSHISRGDNHIVLSTRYFGGNDGILVHYDLVNGVTEFSKVPPHLAIFGLLDRTLYGINFEDGTSSRIMMIRI